MIELKKWKNPCPGHPDFPYAQYTPNEYKAQEDKKWPILVCLHGLGERGTDGSREQLNTPFQVCKPDEGDGLPFFMVAPQCPENIIWNSCIESLNDFLSDIIRLLPVDPGRVYLTGLSMGGTGTWCWALSQPERFAAVIPVCGVGIPWYARRVLKDKPVWVFHGKDDLAIPVSSSIEIVDAINNAGGNAKLTLYDNVGHNSWVNAYSDPELFKWMLEQHL